MNESDELLVVAARKGDRAAFEQLMRRTARLVYARVYLHARSGASAEDLSQEAFLTAWRKIGQLSDSAQFRPWLMRIAESVGIDAARHRQRKKRGSALSGIDVAGIADPDPSPADHAEHAEQKQRAIDALRDLPESYRTPLTLRFLMDADYDTIARQLALSNGSLRGLLHRGMNMLRLRLAERSE